MTYTQRQARAARHQCAAVGSFVSSIAAGLFGLLFIDFPAHLAPVVQALASV